MAMLGCCSSFIKCSNAGKCIYEGDPNFHGYFDFNECLYKENIDKGRNFYTEYNENNRRRAEEYKIKIENSKEIKEKANEENKVTNKPSSRTYIEIPNRLFSIGKRNNYNGYTYGLTDEEREELISVIKEYGVCCTNIESQGQFIEEVYGNNQRCNCKVVISLNDQKYNITNYDHKGLRKDTAVKIASYLIKNNIESEIEEIMNFSGSKFLKSVKVHEDETKNEKTKEKREKQKDSSNNEVLNGQISFFDIENNIRIANGKEKSISKSRYVNNIELVKNTKIDRVCSCCRSVIKAGIRKE